MSALDASLSAARQGIALASQLEARGCRRRGYPMLNLRSSAMRSRQQVSPGRGISPSSKLTNLRAERGLVLFRTGRSAARRAWAVVVGEAMPPRRG